ncbi:hypothetical protein GCM10027277_23840 [Pseudoduganella ginsengisoli]|uniref:Uncharacterized protein n=1 Tax=Pseudoduganella ginsengisoli TaxID=1462440 RepID=A0A6L6PZ52_9BURK|nr:hypothetical protein [Pseudoduganella ginsengisoli]MTW02893.1 hypothetical protein [Pseudoduganella ginsengisoli]
MAADAALTSRATLSARAIAMAKSSPLIAEAAHTRPTDTPLREPSLAQAIGRAGKQGIVERSVEAYTEILIQCQKNQSPILTVPFQRADSQQAHCYRF